MNRGIAPEDWMLNRRPGYGPFLLGLIVGLVASMPIVLLFTSFASANRCSTHVKTA